MADPRDRVEVSGGGDAPGGEGVSQGAAGEERPWLSLWFRCSGQYVRAYRNGAGTGYQGRCPGCGKTVRFAVGAEGTSQRFFEVSC